MRRVDPNSLSKGDMYWVDRRIVSGKYTKMCGPFIYKKVDMGAYIITRGENGPEAHDISTYIEGQPFRRFYVQEFNEEVPE